MKETAVISQARMMEQIIPTLKQEGIVYRKFQKVWARGALEGEIITTITSDGFETKNIAKQGDLVVQNLTKARELYLVNAEKFHERYRFDKKVEEGCSQYHPVGKVVGIAITQSILDQLDRNQKFEFMAPWGKPEKAQLNDFLVSPLNFEEVYRIAQKEFYETYEKDPRPGDQ